MSAVRCSACNSTMCESVPLDHQGNWAIDEESMLEMQTDETGDYIVCPACGAKNVVLGRTSPTGLRGGCVDGVR